MHSPALNTPFQEKLSLFPQIACRSSFVIIMSAKPTLYDPLKIGNITLKNRILLSPMTRDRATIDLVPTDRDADTSMVLYYEQRAAAGEND